MTVHYREYAGVKMRTKQEPALIAAHGQDLDQRSASHLLTELCKAFDVKVVDHEFAGRLTRSYFHPKRTRKTDYGGTISGPQIRFEVGKPYGRTRLTALTVIHEFAHYLHHHSDDRRRQESHGHHFTALLDQAAEVWWEDINHDPVREAWYQIPIQERMVFA